MPYDTIATMILSVSLMTGGAVFGILGMILGFARGMTKNSDTWALIFSSFAWAIALAIPNAPFAMGIFLAGAIGITMAFTPIIKKIPESNILMIAIIAILVNFTLIVGFGAQVLSTNELSWTKNLDDSQEMLNSLLGTTYDTTSIVVERNNGELGNVGGLCAPGTENDGTVGQVCDNKVEKGTIDSSVFDVFATVLAIPHYIGKAVRFAGASLLAPIIIAKEIALKAQDTNYFIYILVGLYILLWEMAIFYKAIIFVLKRQSNM